MNITSKHTFHPGFPLTTLRKSITLLLLFSFLNTIFFPAVCYPLDQHNPIAGFENTTSLAEYLMEDYLGVDEPHAENPEEGVNDIFKTTEDIDFIVYYNTPSTSLASNIRNISYSKLESCTVQSFYSCSTPPPEQFL